jgi:hypothetical protein
LIGDIEAEQIGKRKAITTMPPCVKDPSASIKAKVPDQTRSKATSFATRVMKELKK